MAYAKYMYLAAKMITLAGNVKGRPILDLLQTLKRDSAGDQPVNYKMQGAATRG